MFSLHQLWTIVLQLVLECYFSGVLQTYRVEYLWADMPQRPIYSSIDPQFMPAVQFKLHNLFRECLDLHIQQLLH